MSNPQSAAVVSSPDGRNEASALSPERYQPTTWNLAFVQDCNLRCRYCVTGYGRGGHSSKFMPPEVWRPLADRIVSMSTGLKKINMDFGTGETFLHFDEAMQFLDYLRHRAAGTGVRIEAQITTNGTLATVEQLKICLEKRISLSFSIDGTASTHNSFRRFSDGKPTHRIALKNFRRYREMVRGVADPPGCTVSSVVAGDARLRDVAQYWRKQGVKQYKAIPSEKSRHLGCFQPHELLEIRSRYLEDLEKIVTSEVSRLQGSELVKNYEGPVGILNTWIHLMRAAPCRSCGAGYSVICVDAEGTLFPCLGFVGFAERSIGDIHVGVLPTKLAEFRSARTRVESVCDGCWARFLCDGGCCASDPKTGVVFDTKYGCDFAKSHVELAVKSYHTWCGYMMTNAKTPKETQDNPGVDGLL